MTFDDPIGFREAVEQLVQRKLMPTTLSSAELAKLNKGIMNNSFTSARTTLEGLLDRYKTGILSIINPDQVLREGAAQTVTEGYNPATLRAFIKDYLGSISYQAPEGKAGTIEDLSSDKRINLVVKTNVQIQHGIGHFIQANSDQAVVDAWPAWEFFRAVGKKEPRDWEGANGLWVQACQRAGDMDAVKVYGATERMCALKSSGVWDEISDPDYTPGGLGNPFDPVAFGTGMTREEMSREEAEAIGLLDDGEKAEPAKFDLTTLFMGE